MGHLQRLRCVFGRNHRAFLESFPEQAVISRSTSCCRHTALRSAPLRTGAPTKSLGCTASRREMLSCFVIFFKLASTGASDSAKRDLTIGGPLI